MMRAGKLRHRIQIETLTTGRDIYGEPVETWTLFALVWASREDLAGREFFAAQQVNAEVTTRFGIRFIEGLTPQMRVRDGGTLYDLESVQDPDGRARELILLATRKA